MIMIDHGVIVPFIQKKLPSSSSSSSSSIIIISSSSSRVDETPFIITNTLRTSSAVLLEPKTIYELL